VCVCIYIYIYIVVGLNSGPRPWATPPAFCCEGCFQDRVLWTICPVWLQTEILLISASWVARIIGVSHQHLTHTLIRTKTTCREFSMSEHSNFLHSSPQGHSTPLYGSSLSLIFVVIYLVYFNTIYRIACSILICMIFMLISIYL
jgi:hypothetical protein